MVDTNETEVVENENVEEQNVDTAANEVEAAEVENNVDEAEAASNAEMVEASDMYVAQLAVNPAAMAAFNDKNPGCTRVRVDYNEGTIRLRPTDRKAGRHVLVDFAFTESMVMLGFTSDQVNELEVDFGPRGTKYGVMEGKYGWFILTAVDEGTVEDAVVEVV